MSSKKSYKYIDSKIVIERIKEITGLTQKAIAEQIFDISGKNLSNRIFRDGIDFYALIDWAIDNNIDINWLITGKGHEPEQDPAPDKQMSDDERAWWRGLTDELREKCRKLEKRLEQYEDPTNRGRIRKDDDPTKRDEILKRRAG